MFIKIPEYGVFCFQKRKNIYQLLLDEKDDINIFMEFNPSIRKNSHYYFLKFTIDNFNMLMLKYEN